MWQGEGVGMCVNYSRLGLLHHGTSIVDELVSSGNSRTTSLWAPEARGQQWLPWQIGRAHRLNSSHRIASRMPSSA